MLADFVTYGFLWRALLAGVLVAGIAPVVGMFVTVRRQALIADTLAHASLAGVALGIIFAVNPLLTAMLSAVGMAVVIERLRLSQRLSGDAVLALVLSGSLAFAVVALSAVHAFDGGILAYLFGSIATVKMEELWMIATLALGTIGMVVVRYRSLFLVAFDEEIAAAQGIRVTTESMTLAMVTALIVAVAMRVVGVLLIGALMVIPVLAAMRLGVGFKKTMLFAIGIAETSVIAGLFVSYVADLAPGGTIVLCTVGWFAVIAWWNALRRHVA